jgi:drug/metabolite transporter (DMT)-like permease
VGITLGLGAALSWGLADYFVALAARSAGALRVALAFHLAALIPLTALVLTTGALTNVTPGEVLAFALLGAAGWLSYLAFYRALAIGPISLLSPIVSGYSAVTVVLAVLIAGERLSAVEAWALLVTIAGVIVVSADVSRIGALRIDRRSWHAVALAIAAMVRCSRHFRASRRLPRCARGDRRGGPLISRSWPRAKRARGHDHDRTPPCTSA